MGKNTWYGFRTGLVIGTSIGAAAAAAIYRKQVLDIVANMRPYKRRPAEVDQPTLIINRKSGGGKAEQYNLDQVATEAGIKTILLEEGDDLTELAERALADGADALGMAGGDGSLAVVAHVAADNDVPFFCCPVGTRNHFALDLGLDRTNPLEALDGVADGVEIRVDYGVVGGRAFLNNVSFGVYPEAVKQDTYRDHKVETLMTTAAASPETSHFEFTTPDGRLRKDWPMVLVSNNPYVMSGPPDFGRRVRLDSGRLGVIGAAPADGRRIRVGAGRQPVLHKWQTHTFELESDQELLDVGVDGEAIRLATPITVTIRPRALRVLIPKGTRPRVLPPLRRSIGKPEYLNRLTGAGT